MSCVLIVTYSVIVNRKLGRSFNSSSKLRQGDPLSPYFFLICVECLSVLINIAEFRGDIKGLAITHGWTSMSHLQFADDNFLFC